MPVMRVCSGVAPSAGVARSALTSGDLSDCPPERFWITFSSVVHRHHLSARNLSLTQASLGSDQSSVSNTSPFSRLRKS